MDKSINEIAHYVIEQYVAKRQARQTTISVRGAMVEIRSLIIIPETSDEILVEAIVRAATLQGLAVKFDHNHRPARGT